MALAYGPVGIRCNMVCPGMTQTPMVDDYFRNIAPSGERERWVKRIPLGRYGEPEDVARVIGHLTSDAASYTNGTTLAIDGGAGCGYYWRTGTA
jgi:NAD(P)-dependent dehydrogenase (short-subunit alcohol dehydrogenase family)